jgi:nitrate reductase gamma subunit
MKALFSLFAVLILALLAYAGVQAGQMYGLFGIAVPYAAVAIFTLGVIYRVVKWGRVPVPFHIPTTGGQQKSLAWIKQNKLDNPSSSAGVLGRMALEILTFRSLFRNTKAEYRGQPKLVYGSDKWLWLAALAFHYTFGIVLIRHLRFFTEPVPFFVHQIEAVDGFVQITAPALLQSGIILLAAVTYLLLRRLYLPHVRYISLPSDYFPLFLIMAIATTGILMRYILKTDIIGAKELAMSLVSFKPKVPEGIGVIFYIHLFLVCILFAYFPFSKLMHAGGVFLSPTRNLANDSRMLRHLNPWNYPVKVHTYAEYEDEFREAMIKAGIPVEKTEVPAEKEPKIVKHAQAS